MSTYNFLNDTFIIKDFDKAKRFSSFLPAIAGVKGKPLWVFYANIGQCVGGFGIDNKDTPFTPFDSFVKAKKEIPTNGFRTFIKVDGVLYTPFYLSSKATRTMYINKTSFTIEETYPNLYKYEVSYSTVSNKPYPGLIRSIKITNLDNKKHTFEIIDGANIYFPCPVSNYSFHMLSTLVSAYCSVNANDNKPFFNFKEPESDSSTVKISSKGNGYFYIDENNKVLDVIFDNRLIFGHDDTNVEAINLINNDIKHLKLDDQALENKIPSAYCLTSCTLEKDESYSFVGLFTNADNLDEYNNFVNKLTYNDIYNFINETALLVDSLLPKNISTSNKIFDNYIIQSVLDNNLRGGFPTILGKDKPYYVFSRKHGDMERDYNSFSIPCLYYSSGPGNFRDVNQNRRNDLYFINELYDYNLEIFFSLIQLDGYNPLLVKPSTYTYLKDVDKLGIKLDKKLLVKYTPGSLMSALKKCNLNEEEVDKLFYDILTDSKENIEADYGEGYWSDHFVYNLDLLTNFVSIYPDKMKEILFEKKYKYFLSPVEVNPRSERYCYLEDGNIRQYGAIKEIDKTKYTSKYKLDKDGNVIKATLLEKIINLALVKFISLDYRQVGLEMESERPGWNDALNGLPGLLASSTSESLELLRLIDFIIPYLDEYKHLDINLLCPQYDLLVGVKHELSALMNNKVDNFTYWDKVNDLKEIFRKQIYGDLSSETKEVHIIDLYNLFNEMSTLLTTNLKQEKDKNNGLLPTYFINTPTKYVLLDEKNHLGYNKIIIKQFSYKNVPLFLEGIARSMKNKSMYDIDTYKAVCASDLKDKKLNIYQTSVSLDGESYEIGRIRLFSKGWLERESSFLHMDYKYLLGFLKAHLYEQFFEEIKTSFVPFMDPSIYGRSPLENVSFIVPSNNADKSMHGSGQYARLTGANAEVIDMYYILCVGENLFLYENNELTLNIRPKFAKEFFDENGCITFPLFKDVKVTIYNPNNIDAYKCTKVEYEINNVKYSTIKSLLAEDIRNKKIKEIKVIIS